MSRFIYKFYKIFSIHATRLLNFMATSMPCSVRKFVIYALALCALNSDIHNDGASFKALQDDEVRGVCAKSIFIYIIIKLEL